MAPSNRSTVQESPFRGTSSRMIDDSSYIGSIHGDEPRAAYSKVKERLMELEIEKEQQSKAYEMVKVLRQKDKDAASKQVEQMKWESEKQADDVRHEMAERIEKQVSMIEDLLGDKKSLSGRVEELTEELKDQNHQKTRQAKVIDDRL